MARCSVPFVGVMIAYLTVGLWSLECGKANRANAKTIEHDRTGSVITQSLVLALTQYVRHDPPAHDPAPSQLDVRTRRQESADRTTHDASCCASIPVIPFKESESLGFCAEGRLTPKITRDRQSFPDDAQGIS